MALNLSHRPNLVQSGSQDKDILESLPADPFGMDTSTMTAAITGWLKDLRIDYDSYGGGEVGVGKGDYQLLAGWNFWFEFPRNVNFDDRKVSGSGFDGLEDLGRCPVYDGGVRFACTLEGAKFGNNTNVGFDGFGNGNYKEYTGLDGCFPEEVCGRPVFDGGVHFECSLEDGFDRTGNYGQYAKVDGYVPKEVCGRPEFDGCVHFECSLEDGRDVGAANASFDRIGNYREYARVDGYVPKEVCGRPEFDGGVHFERTLEDGDGAVNASFDSSIHNHGENAADVDDGAPHPALSYALAYLGIRDLLSVERVCKSLCYTVQNDPLLWRNIHIDHPLNDKVTDDVLLQLTSRAQGSLQCLSLVECNKITDDGLKLVLESNLRLIKLSVPGCTRLSIDGVVNCLRAFKKVAFTGIKYLRVGGLFGVTHKHFEELMLLLSINNHVQVNRHNPHFYHRGNVYLSYEDDRPIDIEMCPRCQNLRLVYDCPAEGCQGDDHNTQLCRACTLCIQRCVQCGKCITDGEYEETFCLELLCSDCWKEVLDSLPERQGVGINASEHAVALEPANSFHG